MARRRYSSNAWNKIQQQQAGRGEPVFLLAEFTLTLLAYTAFFCSSAALMSLKYDLSEF